MNPKKPPDGAKLIVLVKNVEGRWHPICFATSIEDGERRRADAMRMWASCGARFYGVRYADIDPDREYDPWEPRTTDPTPLWEKP